MRIRNLWNSIRVIGQDLADEFNSYLNQAPYFVLLCFSIFVLTTTSTLSRAKPFWYDELHTFYICRLPTLADSLRAVRDGADLNPPFLFLFTRAFMSFFGANEVAVRLPAAFGFILMQVSLFSFIGRRATPAVALASITLPLVTGAHPYAYEARPYGLLLGFCALSAWMWQRLVDESLAGPRIWRHVAFSAALSAAILTHTLAILLFAPFGLAEILRNIRARKIDWPVWTSLLVPPLAVAAVFYPPLMHSQTKAVTNIALLRPAWASIPESYRFLLEPAFFPLVITIALISFWSTRAAPAERRCTSSFTGPELALAAALAALPACTVIFCAFFTGIFASRYSLCGIIGCTLLFASLVARSLNQEGRKCLLVAMIFVGFFVGPRISLPALSRPATLPAVSPPLEKTELQLPFVIADGLQFLVTEHYADDVFAKRLVYVYDPASAARYTGANPFEISYPDTWKRYPLRGRVIDYSSFLKATPEFLILSNQGAPFEWLPRKLMDDGLVLQAIAIRPEGILYKVSRVSPPAAQ